MKILKLCFVISLLLCLTYCTKAPLAIEKICEYQRSFDRFSDSTFVSSAVEDIADHNNYFYLSDALNGRFVVLDSNYNMKQAIGSLGEGPGEFLVAASFSSYRDSIYIFDFQKYKTSVFNSKGIYSRDILNKNRPEAQGFRFPDNGSYVMSTTNLAEPISIYDLNGNRIKGFGRRLEKYVSKEKKLFNRYNIRNMQLINNKYIIAVFRSQPIIEVYDIEGKILYEKDIMNLEEIKKLYDDKDLNTLKGALAIFRSILVKGNRLFALVSNRYGNDYAPNLIMEFEINETDVVYKNYYLLETKKGEASAYSCFNFNGNNIIAFNERNRTLDIYKIQK